MGPALTGSPHLHTCTHQTSKTRASLCSRIMANKAIMIDTHRGKEFSARSLRISACAHKSRRSQASTQRQTRVARKARRRAVRLLCCLQFHKKNRTHRMVCVKTSSSAAGETCTCILFMCRKVAINVLPQYCCALL